ncbi:substrate-binding domain-containing protein, partial [Amnibacterium sp.]|uniref:substrate-binding domain-containing protein n=1 Tax=Amnibacterium sp. TaxID=1872496 RepID=UPI00261C0D30
MRRAVALMAATGAVLAGLVGCSSTSGAGTTSASNADVKKAEAALASMGTGAVLSKGPHGETADPASSANLTADDIAAVKAKHATAAIVMHYGGNDWATAQIAGLKSEFAQLGIQLIATTDANFKPDLQVSQLQTVMTKKPDIVVSIPTDPVATASAYKAAAAAGAKLVFMDNVPNGMSAGKDYVADVSADNYGNGVVSAYEMAKALGGQGKIGVIFHQAD